ncbi:type I-B CRISPR-associated protein Cas7/Cst2/DevR [Clostridium fermenticellae]|uniref:Type I-B CRISPR-associated protein Cas7/Cst2/DevR n=1 Tax=Clostridium fermenticellae TaxID=2068654 RepID=A0A386H3F6_9CLOT|nr:type I-B CRISPR-associated protein Cas7/Cst2/DevR [Clostridium fermenticellae]AYD40184.1 type I-B CRISPR-associated protein Cas7/Cst2/DevR [Clostridium fermenticellae]
MNKKGLTASFIFEAESANYGEGVGNVAALKKISRGTGESYTYISRQALRYNIVQQMGEDNTPLDLDGSVIQFAIDATIKEYPEIDLFGYMKTKKPGRTRAAVVRLSNAISLESFNSDMDFLTNKSLLDRYTQQGEEIKGGNIAQSEIHKSYYAYTIAIDLDLIGADGEIEIENSEKAKRINKLLETIKFLYRDIKGRRENLSPVFAIGGVYDLKNPFFENKLRVYKNNVMINSIESVYNLDKSIKPNTKVGLINGIFNNEKQISEKLSTVDMGEFFSQLEDEVNSYYLESK